MNHLPGASEMLALQILRGGAEGFSQYSSFVLMDRERVVGAILVKPGADHFLIGGIAVEPELRNGRAATRLVLLAARKFRERGVEKVRFAANQTLHPQVWKVAGRLHAATLWARRGYHRDL